MAWRIAMLAGLDTGFAEVDLFRGSTEGTVYVLGLEVVQVVVAVLCFGLIRPWGEVLPRWVPVLGGRRIHRLLPTAVGAMGNLVLFAIIGTLLVQFLGVWLGLREGWTPDAGMAAGERALLLVCYIPFFAWPVAVAIAVAGYWMRRRPSATPSSDAVQTTEGGTRARPEARRADEPGAGATS